MASHVHVTHLLIHLLTQKMIYEVLPLSHMSIIILSHVALLVLGYSEYVYDQDLILM